MDFILNKRTHVVNAVAKTQSNHHVNNESTDSTVHSHHFLFGLLEDSGIATSNDAHSLEFDDQIPITPPPTIIVEQHLDQAEIVHKHPAARIGALEKSKASSSIPSLSINSNATINIHYYPEESIFWSYVIVFISVTVQVLIHGLQLSFGVLFVAAKVFFKNDQLITIGNFPPENVSNLKREKNLRINQQYITHKCHKNYCFHLKYKLIRRTFVILVWHSEAT